MAGIGLGMGFELNAESFLDIRQSFDTLEQMKAFPESSVPEGFTAYNKETKKDYRFDKTNDEDPTLGKWRLKESGGSGAAIDDTQASLDTTYSSDKIEKMFSAFGGHLIVESLPEASTADPKKVYLVKDETNGSDPNAYNEYMALEKEAEPGVLFWEKVGSTESATLEYKTSSPVNNPMGKVPANYETAGIPIPEIIDMMLHKDVKATVAISCSDAGLKEKGVSSVTNPVLTATITPGTCTPVSVQFFKDGVALGDAVPFVESQLTYTFTDDNSGAGVTLINTTKYSVKLTYKLNASDSSSLTATAEYTYVFVYPFYFGTSITEPVDEAGLTKDLSQMPTNKSITKSYTGTNAYAVLLFDSDYTLKSILDQNGFECKPGFTTKTVVVGGGSYTLCYTTNPATLTNFKYTFKFA